MIHEIFSPIEDPQLAKTCSEIFTGEYRYVQDEEEKARYGADSELLTNPDIQLLTLQASYIEEAPDGNLHNPIKFATFGPQLPLLESMKDVYADSIGKLQKWGTENPIVSMMSNIERFEGGWRAVSSWYGDEVAKKGRSLLSAYFLGCVAGDNNVFVETLVYPEHIRQDLRLLIRDGFISSLPMFDSEFQATMRDELLDNERLYTLAGDICASNQLLNPEDFQRLFGPYLEGSGPVDQDP